MPIYLIYIHICITYIYRYLSIYLSKKKGNGNPLQYSCLENPMDRGAWQAIVHGVLRVGHNLMTKPSIYI